MIRYPTTTANSGKDFFPCWHPCYAVAMKVNDYIDTLSQRFEQADLCYAHGTDNPWDEACYLVFATLSLDFEDFPTALQRKLSESELQLLEERARRRLEDRIPTAYLVGTAWFAGHPFKSDHRALIPRSPIAELIGQRFNPLLASDPQTVLDLCCGGGCLGIAVALAFPEARVDVLDNSSDALDLARENVSLHGLEERVRVIRSDLFTGLIGRRYDLIVSNPPYVSQQEIDDLPAEFNHEPSTGLLSADNGMELPKRILAEAVDHLNEDGILILEVGYSHPELSARYPDIPFLWLEFEQGGEGVLMLTHDQLAKYRERFK
jgi:ribosomal protein L3 glutamine methyltransferase